MNRLVSWLRRSLKRFLEGEDCVSPDLEVLSRTPTGAVVRKYRVVGSQRVDLIGVPVDGVDEGMRMITSSQAMNQDQFWRLWRQYNPDVSLTWSDGTKMQVGN